MKCINEVTNTQVNRNRPMCYATCTNTCSWHSNVSVLLMNIYMHM